MDAASLTAAITSALLRTDGLVFLDEARAVPGVPEGRVLPLPVADRGAVGVAVGFGLAGRPAVVGLSSSARLLACLDRLHEAAAVELAAPVVVRVAWGFEAGAAVDPAVLDAVAGVPGLRVVVPRSAGRAPALVAAALSRPGLTVLLEPRDPGAGVGDDGPAVAAGVEVVRAGRDAVVAAWGPGVATAVRAAEALAQRGIEVCVVDLVTLAPLDEAGLGALVRATGRLVVAAPRAERGFARRVGRAALDAAFLYLEAPLGVAPDDDVDALVREVAAAVTW